MGLIAFLKDRKSWPLLAWLPMVLAAFVSFFVLPLWSARAATAEQLVQLAPLLERWAAESVERPDPRLAGEARLIWLPESHCGCAGASPTLEDFRLSAARHGMSFHAATPSETAQLAQARIPGQDLLVLDAAGRLLLSAGTHAAAYCSGNRPATDLLLTAVQRLGSPDQPLLVPSACTCA